MSKNSNFQKTAVILSLSSDIGAAFALRKIEQGWKVFGTYRKENKHTELLVKKGASLFQCDLLERELLLQATQAILGTACIWDCLMVASGSVSPVGPFESLEMTDWENSLVINLTAPLFFLHQLLPMRRRNESKGASILFFSGSGTNNAPLNYSAYTLSKIALIKACELLDAEILDAQFSIIGPGIVDTKIHEPTFLSKDLYPSSYQKVREAQQAGNCTPMERVLDCCDWVIQQPKKLVGGRNFSVQYDPWAEKTNLEEFLTCEPDFFKLRRYGNNVQFTNKN